MKKEKTKKIFVYVASNRCEDSNTFRYVSNVLFKVKSLMNNNVSINIFHPKNSNVNRCLGCEKCFYTGKCPQDKIDDMKTIKNEMLLSDMIILASPIYSINISADMKIIFDRIACFAHLMALRNKPGICILTSCGNGVHFTLNYMNTLMTFFGLDVIDKYNVSFYTKRNLEIDKNYMLDKIEESAIKITNYLNGKEKVKSNESLETVFRNMKNYIKTLEQYDTYEYRYWKNNNMINAKTYDELLLSENCY